ncbi:O-antigen ligase family protein [Gammaproteobacteria bacterium]|nr:O-antigen ligase family protein [Gammaproteobacteria bacterium]
MMDRQDFNQYLTALSINPLRILMEHVIYIYYIFYFVFLPSIVLRTQEHLDQFFKTFFFIFKLFLILGILDYLVSAYIPVRGEGFLPRHLKEYYGDIHWVGVRFHSIAGEPRDAFVFGGFGLGMHLLHSFIHNYKVNPYFISLILLCMLLTYSASGIMSILIFVGLFLLYNIYKNIKTLLPFFFLIPVFLAGLYFYINNSTRLLAYLEVFQNIYTMYQTGIWPEFFKGQLPNVIPIIWIIDHLISYNPIPFLIGGGFGHASIVNMFDRIWELERIVNPHANIIRVLSETGIVGFALFLYAFLGPIKKMFRRIFSQRITLLIFFLALFEVSLTLGHRSSSAFIFFGILAAASRILTNLPNKN